MESCVLRVSGEQGSASARAPGPRVLSAFWSVRMSIPSVVQSILALYGFGDRAHAPRRRPGPVMIGAPQPKR
ncbi:MAG: hypothetical protein EBR82_31630 [Caulobacteraceae bacterium]|nr:hypothetical protein [Caulobacteraceae bacterium]